MGIAGLTTFFEKKSDLYLEKHVLYNTDIVIDGNSIACQLYTQWHTTSNDYFECFGGDYDKFGKVVKDFFDLLKQCNVTPYVVFDGGYETKKLTKIMDRKKSRLKYATQLNPFSESKQSAQKLFCLFMNKVFEDIVKARGLKIERRIYEGDDYTADFARKMNCPILGFDSDYFIFGSLYIPFNTLKMKIENCRISVGKLTTCINCKIYRMESFLKLFNGLQRDILPILAILLGNDIVEWEVFKNIREGIISQRCSKVDQIQILLNWLQNKTPTDVLEQILFDFKGKERENIEKKIGVAIKGYQFSDVSNAESEKASTSANIGLGKPKNINNLSIEELITEEKVKNIPPKFLAKFKQVIYPPSFMNIYLQDTYYYIVQIENNNPGTHSHQISFEILSAIQKILKNGLEQLTYIGRISTFGLGKERVPKCKIALPKNIEIDSMDINDKQKIIFKILGIDYKLLDCLKLFTNSWKIFFLAIFYYLNKSPRGRPLTYSLIMCKLVLSYIDKKVGGFFRSKQKFQEHLEYLPVEPKTEFSSTDNIQYSLESITKHDSVECLKALIAYFEVDQNMKTNPKEFDRFLAHSISEFQSCLLHIHYLNVLLDFPFPDFSVQECLNCTFIYNLTADHFKSNLEEYKILLKEAPSVFNSFKNIINTLNKCNTQSTNLKRRRESGDECLPTNKRVKLGISNQ